MLSSSCRLSASATFGALSSDTSVARNAANMLLTTAHPGGDRHQPSGQDRQLVNRHCGKKPNTCRISGKRMAATMMLPMTTAPATIIQGHGSSRYGRLPASISAANRLGISSPTPSAWARSMGAISVLCLSAQSGQASTRRAGVRGVHGGEAVCEFMALSDGAVSGPRDRAGAPAGRP
jgi:hypothetical protein